MRVEITKPGKRLFPDGTTKADLAGYYEAVADVMLPHIHDRPLNLERHPDGVRRAAREFGDLLRELGLEPFVMATGSKGFHVVVPLQRRHGFDDVRAFARDVARVAVERDPQRLTMEQRKAKRGGRIFVDILRNGYAHTAVAPYSVRARPSPTVAVPLDWDELGRARPDGWTIKTLPRRLDKRGDDPWARIGSAAQSLGAARRALEK